MKNYWRMKFKGECAKAESSYRIVFCKVRKKDAERFEEALGKLESKMLLFGYTFDTFDDFITKLQLALGEILKPTFLKGG